MFCSAFIEQLIIIIVTPDCDILHVDSVTGNLLGWGFPRLIDNEPCGQYLLKELSFLPEQVQRLD